MHFCIQEIIIYVVQEYFMFVVRIQTKPMELIGYKIPSGICPPSPRPRSCICSPVAYAVYITRQPISFEQHM